MKRCYRRVLCLSGKGMQKAWSSMQRNFRRGHDSGTILPKWKTSACACVRACKSEHIDEGKKMFLSPWQEGRLMRVYECEAKKERGRKKKKKCTGKMVWRQAGRVTVLANEIKEKVKWKWKLSIGVELRVNKGGMIRLLRHNQSTSYLTYNLY